MKAVYKRLSIVSLGISLSLCITSFSFAQRGGHGGGSGHFGGGGGRSGSVGGARSFSAPHSNFGSQSRTFQGGSRVGVQVNRPNTYNAYSSRGSVGIRSYSGGGGRTASGYRGYYGQGGYNRGYYNRLGYYGGYYNRGYYGPGYWGHRAFWGYRSGFYYNSGFYASLYWPRIGFSVGFLPFGYYPFFWGDTEYYFSDGYYYQRTNDQYTIVEPPLGAEIKNLPSGAKPIMIDGLQYYELNGVYYQQITKDDNTIDYVIAGKDGQLNTANGTTAQALPKIGDSFDKLPADTRKIKLNGQLFYVTPDDYYYQESLNANGNKIYKVVGTPSDELGNK